MICYEFFGFFWFRNSFMHFNTHFLHNFTMILHTNIDILN